MRNDNVHFTTSPPKKGQTNTSKFLIVMMIIDKKESNNFIIGSKTQYSSPYRKRTWFMKKYEGQNSVMS